MLFAYVMVFVIGIFLVAAQLASEKFMVRRINKICSISGNLIRYNYGFSIVDTPLAYFCDLDTNVFYHSMRNGGIDFGRIKIRQNLYLYQIDDKTNQAYQTSSRNLCHKN